MVCVESGLGLDAAMRKVCDEMKEHAKVICEELSLANFQLQMGRPRREVLHDLGVRTGVDDVRSLAAILIQADRFGSSIAQALRVQSDSMRTRRKQMAEEKAAKTAVQLIFPLVLFIFPGIFVVLVGPAAISIMNTMLKKLDEQGSGEPRRWDERGCPGGHPDDRPDYGLFKEERSDEGIHRATWPRPVCVGAAAAAGASGLHTLQASRGPVLPASATQYMAGKKSTAAFAPAGAKRPRPRPDRVELPLRAGHRQADRRAAWTIWPTWPAAGRTPDPPSTCRRPRTWPTTRPARSGIGGSGQELDAKRVEAVQKFLTRRRPAGRCISRSLVHDPADVSLSAVGVDGNSSSCMYARVRRRLPTGARRRPAAAAAAAAPAAAVYAAGGVPARARPAARGYGPCRWRA